MSARCTTAIALRHSNSFTTTAKLKRSAASTVAVKHPALGMMFAALRQTLDFALPWKQ